MQDICMNCMSPLGAEGEKGQSCPHCGWPRDGENAPHQLRPGTVLGGRYLVGRSIGQGGFGITYVGRDNRLDLKIAVKEYFPTGYANRNTQVSSDVTVTDKEQMDFIQEGKKRFLQEARTLAQFSENAGVVNVRDYFEENQTAYIIMEYLDGRDLRQCLRDSLFPAERIFALMGPVLDALEIVHREGVIHRDISPDNIIMLKNGTLKLTDFGAARQANFADEHSVSILLKAGFAPEEQYRSKGVQGPWTDIYALCATIYKCITGITPEDSLQRGVRDELQWPSELGVSISPQQEAVLKKGLAVRREERFQSIGELKQALSPEDGGAEEDEHTVYHAHVSRRGKEAAQGGAGAIGEEGAPDASRRAESEESAPPEQEAGADSAQNRAHGQGKAFLAAGAAALLLVMGLAFALLKGGQGQADFSGGPSPAAVSALPSANPAQPLDGEVDGNAAYHIVLTLDNRLTVRDFNEALSILTQRLDILTGGSPYEMDVKDESIELRVPKAAFGGIDVIQALKCYVTRPTELYIFNRGGSGEYIKMEKEALSREDLASVQLTQGSIPGVDAAQYGVEGSAYQYLTVTLTEQCAQRLSGEIAAWGGDLTFGQDIDTSPTEYYYHITFPAGDGKTFYLLNRDPGEQFAQLVAYNLTHDCLAYSFGIIADLSDRAAWQNPEGDAAAGASQCGVSELTGETVTFTLEYRAFSELTAGEQLDMETELKARLDLLDRPYAFGRVEDEAKVIFAVRTGLERMGYPVIALLRGSYTEIKTNFRCLDSSVSGLSWEQNPDGTYRVEAEVLSLFAEDLAELTGLLAEQGGGAVTLFADSLPMLSTRVDQACAGGRISFEHLCFDVKGEGEGEESGLTADKLWLLQLMERSFTRSQSVKTLSLGELQLNLEEGITISDTSGLGVSYAQSIREVAQAVRAVYPDAGVSVSQDLDTVYVTVDLEVNEDLPKAMTDAGREIYEASGLASSDFRRLVIYVADEDAADGERARLFFQKSFSRKTGGQWPEGCVYVSGIFMNGRMERYKEDFRRIVETDPFYLGLISEERTFWTLEP